MAAKQIPRDIRASRAVASMQFAVSRLFELEATERDPERKEQLLQVLGWLTVAKNELVVRVELAS